MTEKWHGGKGSRYRKVDQKAYNENWERIFGNKDMKFTTAEEYMSDLPSAVDDAAKAMEESAAKRKADKDAE